MDSPHSFAPNSTGTNIASVLKNWEKTFPEIFNEIINEFQKCFPSITEIFFTQHDLLGDGRKTPILTLKEKKIDNAIIQTKWSDGMSRVLFLLMTVKIPFPNIHPTLPPSLVLIDEIENGLDYTRLKYIMNYLKDYSDDSQILISSHSPLVCDFVHPKNWRIVKRKGSEIKFSSPQLIEEDLDSQLDIFKQKHWDFYTKHIANSEKYNH